MLSDRRASAGGVAVTWRDRRLVGIPLWLLFGPTALALALLGAVALAAGCA